MAESPKTPESSGVAAGADASVGGLAELYLGNILYALERCAMSLDEEGKPMDSAFYRGIGRKLAEAYGRARRDAESRSAGDA
jgi:hypothetical protein